MGAGVGIEPARPQGYEPCELTTALPCYKVKMKLQFRFTFTHLFLELEWAGKFFLLKKSPQKVNLVDVRTICELILACPSHILFSASSQNRQPDVESL